MRRRSFLPLLAILLALTGVVFAGFYVSRLPRTLSIAVGPLGLETHRFAEALAQAGREARERIRLNIVTTGGAAESARLLETGKVDLAIIRSDYDLPANGQSLIVNTRRAAVVMAPIRNRGGIQTFTDLKGKRIAVPRLTDSNLPVVRRMLDVAEIGQNDATLVECDLAELPELLGNGKVDAAIALVVVSAPNFTALVPEIVKRLPGGLRIVPVEQAQAMASRITGLDTVEIPAGAFGARRPVEETTTIALTYRTVARATMSEDVASQAAKSFFDLRARLNRTVPIAFNAEAPDAKTGSKLPVHPGATAFFDGETKTFFERYGELIFTGLWSASILGSGVAGMFAWLGRRKHSEAGDIITELAALTTEARGAVAVDVLARIEARTDIIVADVAAASHGGRISPESLESIGLALEHLRSVIETNKAKVR